jgi:hypothetical protein
MSVTWRTAAAPEAAPVAPVDGAASAGGLALWLARATMLAALAELVLLRTATRTAIHIPGIDRVAIGFRAVAEAGRLGYYLAVVLLTAALGAMVVALHRAGHDLPAAAVGFVLATAVAGRVGWAGAEVLDLAAVVAVAALAVGVARRLPRPVGLAVLLYAVAFALIGWPQGVDSAAVAGEAAAVAAMISLGLPALRGADRLIVGTAVAVASATLVGLVVSPATPKILLLWNAGLTGVLPAAVYALAFGAVAAAIVRLWRAGRAWTAVALCLLVEAGVGFHSTYQSGLAILGLAVLTLDLPDVGPRALPAAAGGGASSE